MWAKGGVAHNIKGGCTLHYITLHMYYIHLYPHCYTLAQLYLPIGLQMERRPLKGTRSHPFDPKEIEEFEIEVVAYQSLR